MVRVSRLTDGTGLDSRGGHENDGGEREGENDGREGDAVHAARLVASRLVMYRLFQNVLLAVLLGMSSAVVWGGAERDAFGPGRVATDDEIRAWESDVAPDGEGLPVGGGTVEEGANVYAERCASCHGATGVEGPMSRLVGGQGTLATAHPLKTVGSYWPYATTLFDYIYRAMPFDAPQSLTPDQVYAVAAWIMFRNGLLEQEAALNQKTLPLIQMPNRNGFAPDPRPDVH